MAGQKTTRQKQILVTFMQTRDMYLHFTRSNIWANGNNYNFSSRVENTLVSYAIQWALADFYVF